MTRARVVGRALEKRFGRSAALRGVDFELGSGEVLALLGPNGAGKSTLLRMVAGLSRPSAGSLLIDEIPAGRPQARARIGYVGHATCLYPQLSARENLIFAGRLHGLRDAASRADALLAEEALAAAADRPAGGFSRGMAQRLALARARMHEPSVLLLDEPFTGLDRRASAALALRIRALRGEGRALLLVTHDLAQAAELADAALVLARGQCAARLARPELSASALEAAYAAAAENAA